jgi:hypothetical protein
MKTTLNEKLIAYLALFSGLALSVVAEYYSIVGLTAIFPTAVIPVIIMGVALGLGKIVATVWLKQNWSIAPLAVKSYLMVAIMTLMFITSMGIFGFLSKAHLEQTVPTSDVAAKIALIDEQISVEKGNIDEARKSLAQLDAQVDQRLSRSTDDKGAERAVQIRRQQQAERSRLQKDIASAQTNIGRLNVERAPIAADLRKIEAEVGPIKYIAQFVYGEADQTLLEKAVTWVIIILIAVFDPMALILLLASQISFQNFREREKEIDWQARTDELLDIFDEETPDPYVADVGEKPTAEELAEGDSPEKESDVVSTATVTEHRPDTHPYLKQGFKYPEGWNHHPPMVYKPEEPATTSTYQILPELQAELDKDEPLFVQNEEQKDSSLWSATSQISREEYEQLAGGRRQDVIINEWVNKIKNREITMADVPEHLLLEVRARV